MTASTKNDVIPAGYFAPEDDGDERVFAAWMKDARKDAVSRHGLTRVPRDTWRTQFALGKSPAQAAQAVADHYQAYGSKVMR